MKQETYTELEKIIVKGAKDDYLTFEVFSGMIGILLVLGLVSSWGNIPMMILFAVGITVFVQCYLPLDVTMQERTRKKQALADEIKKDVN